MADRQPTDPPGALVIADRVVEKIATRAALNVDGVVRHQDTVGSLLGAAGDRLGIGADLPRATVDSVGSARRLSLTVALTWPSEVTRLTREIRSRVADELEEYTGVRPVRVDVTVRHLVPRGEVSRRKNGYIDLPALADADTRAESHRLEEETS
ncbi:Asp23/Gls24 family envelope stress response protein [Gordonia malaquae]|uniref:Asp23/Gls24 family envelope stress response protein n=1 Tax=Gordonia malaquae TaxID=410332 RepID=UPI0030FF273C